MISKGLSKMNFNPRTDIASLAGKVILVTGGTDGLGKESVRELSLHNPAKIYLTARSRAKAESVVAELDKQHPGHSPIQILDLDLSSLANVKSAIDQFLVQNDRLDILICNAGRVSAKGTTQDGYETTFGVNHVGHALLVKLLLPTLTKTAEEFPVHDPRVVLVSSKGETSAPAEYTFKRMKSELSDLSVMARYGQSKLANIHYAAQLAKRYPHITFSSVHPGRVRTNFASGYFEDTPILGRMYRVAMPLLGFIGVAEGVKCQLWAATARKEDLANGEYYVPVGVAGQGSEKTRDVAMSEALWDWTEEQLQPFS